MKFDLSGGEVLTTMGANAQRVEWLGYDGVFSAELTHDPFISAALLAGSTNQIEVGTQVAIAFARSPMTIAVSARDLQTLSGGRFILGLGSQVSAHITRRFSMPWSHPAPRMAEMIRAIRAIWHTWKTGDVLSFEGEFYSHTLMTATFVPQLNDIDDPPIWLAAVGPGMAKVAAAQADGLVVHGFCTQKYLFDVLKPSLDEGLRSAERSGRTFTLSAPIMTVSGASPDLMDASAERTRRQIAFYGSTPAYRGVLEVHGWGALADELHALSVTKDPNRWTQMSALVSDDVLETFAVIAEPAALPAAVLARYGDAVDRISLPVPDGVADEDWRTIMTALKAVPAI